MNLEKQKTTTRSDYNVFPDMVVFCERYFMMPGSKGLNPHELAHRWMKDLGIRPDMSIKVG